MFVFVCVMGDLGVVIMVERKTYRETNIEIGMFVFKCCNFVP